MLPTYLFLIGVSVLLLMYQKTQLNNIPSKYDIYYVPKNEKDLVKEIESRPQPIECYRSSDGTLLWKHNFRPYFQGQPLIVKSMTLLGPEGTILFNSTDLRTEEDTVH